MAFAWISHENFELGTLGVFDAEVDSDSKLNFSHFSTLSKIPGVGMPFSGAYCMHVDLAGGTSDAYVQETSDWDMTAGTNELYLRFMLWVDPELVMADTNEMVLMEFWSSTNTAEGGAMLNFTDANGLRLGIGKATAAQFLPITQGEWHSVELFFNPAGGGAGTLDAWLDGVALTQVASLTNANITSGILGCAEIDAGTTRGHILFDDVIGDDARIFTPNERYPEEILMTKTGHAFVGAGKIDNVSLLSGAGTDCVVTLWDTDVANTDDAGSMVLELKNTANNEIVDPAGMPVTVRRGAYISMSGTTPRVLLNICRASHYHSEAAVRTYGNRRLPAPGAV